MTRTAAAVLRIVGLAIMAGAITASFWGMVVKPGFSAIVMGLLFAGLTLFIGGTPRSS